MNPVYSNYYVPTQQNMLSFRGSSPVATNTQPSEKKGISFWGGTCLAISLLITGIAALKTHRTNDIIKKAGLQDKSKINLFKTFFHNLNLMNWSADSKKIGELLTKNYEYVGDSGRLFKNPQGDTFIIVDGKKAININSGDPIENIEHSLKDGTKILTTAEMANQSGIKIPQHIQKQWDEIIPQIINNPTEKAFVHDTETGKLIATAKGDEDFCWFEKEENAKLKNATKQNIKMAMIHNHVTDITFSSEDFNSILNPQSSYEIMGVVTKGGGFGILKRKELISQDAFIKNQMLLKYHDGLEMGLITKLQLKNKSDFEILQEVEKLRAKNFPIIARECGYQYSYIPAKQATKNVIPFPDYLEELIESAEEQGTKLTKEDIIKDDYFSVNLEELVTELKKCTPSEAA